MELADDYPFTKYEENGDIQCETCNKKFFAPGLCDTCFLEAVKLGIVKKVKEAEQDRILAIIQEQISELEALPRKSDYVLGQLAGLKILLSKLGC